MSLTWLPVGMDTQQAVCPYTRTRYQVTHTGTPQHGPYMLTVFIKDEDARTAPRVLHIQKEEQAKEIAENNSALFKPLDT